MPHLLSLHDLDAKQILYLIEKGLQIKAAPGRFQGALKDKTLLMIFAKPSLRTRLSFEVAMTQLGGHAIYYDLASSPLGKGKETIQDTGRTASLYCDVIMARLFEHSELEELARGSSVPVINGLTNFSHPCQVLADLMTIREKKGRLSGLKLAYLGDGNNNITHSLLFSCPKLGISISIASPGEGFMPQPEVVAVARSYEAPVTITSDPREAIDKADVVVTDSWMSYHVPKELEAERIKILAPYQVNARLMSHAKANAIFMHCLPATRGQEVSPEVIDGSGSVVWEEAANRLHIQKAIVLWLLGRV
jgi:ornithine carbamoyltransferase